MFYYWKDTEKKGGWKLAKEGDSNVGMLHRTVLSLDKPWVRPDSEEGTSGTKQSEVKYFGPMYFDIDFKPEEDTPAGIDKAANKAIAACRRLIKNLKDRGMSGIQIYASGVKGFHVLVPEEAFGLTTPQPYLYDAYRMFARHVWVDGLDEIYNGKSGRMLRMPNMRRPSNTYKVGVTEEELAQLTPQGYRDLVSQPRWDYIPPKPSKNQVARAFFNSCKQEAAQDRKDRKKLSESHDTGDLVAIHKDGLPGCIEKLITAGDEKEGSNFNQATLQFATYVVDAKLTREEYESLASVMAHNVQSSHNPSKNDRYNYILNQIAYIHNSGYHFQKLALFSVINKCGKCQICRGSKQGEQGLVVEDRLNLQIGDFGYAQMKGKWAEPATNFTLSVLETKWQVPIAWHSGTSCVSQASRKPAGMKLLMKVHDSVGSTDPIEVHLSEEASNSAPLARDVITAHGGTFFSGPEVWNKVRAMLTDRGNLKKMQADDVVVVPHFGILTLMKKGEDYSLYVDAETCFMPERSEALEANYRTEFPGDPKGVSLQNARSRMPNSKNLAAWSQAKMLDQKGYDRQKFKEMIQALSQVIPREHCAVVLGWFAGAHLKTLLKSRAINYSLLNLYGVPGCGKTETALLMIGLHGVYGRTEGTCLIDCSRGTEAGIRDILSQSVSIPTILDEFNHPMGHDKYQRLGQLLKSSWDSSAAPMIKGGISSTIPTSPVVTCGEQPIAASNDALRTRNLEIGYSITWKTRPECAAAYQWLTRNHKFVASFGLDLIQYTVNQMTPDEVVDLYDEYCDELPLVSNSERKRGGYAAAMLGIRLMELTASEYLGYDMGEEAEVLRSRIVEHAEAENKKETQVTSNLLSALRWIVETVDEAVNTNADLPKNLEKGYQYDEVGGRIWIKLDRFYEHGRATNRDVFTVTPSAFFKLLEGDTPEFAMPWPGGNKKILGFEVDTLKEMGWWGQSLDASISSTDYAKVAAEIKDM